MSGLLLDTHVLIWIGDKTAIASQVQRAIDEAYRSDAVYVSAISAWEITRLAVRDRIRITSRPDAWFNRLVEITGFATLPLTAECAVAAALLPDLHRDPADRFLIATAQLLDLTLVTRDLGIRRYADAGHVRVLIP
jgi:PIN domain nuclease of toxin-antitoxin system